MAAKKKKLITIFAVVAALLIALIVWIAWGNTALELNTYTIISEELPDAFDGYCIAHVSDLHNAEMGDDNEKLLAMLREAEPDVIAITGDLIDSRNTEVEIALTFAEEAVKIAPCYYVTGNHEARIDQYNELIDGLESKGVVHLHNESVILEQDNESITLIGVRDPSFQADYLFDDEASVVDSVLSELMRKTNGYTVLLSHRPEMFYVYVSNEVDLVLSGHAHGGQFRLPFVGGVVAPGQGLFPEYDAGLYTEDNTSMIVSRGIGNSILPIRLNNRPEVILIELQSK